MWYKSQVWALLVTAALAVSPVHADAFIEDAVQEIETLINKNYSGRARTLALKRLDTLLESKESEAEQIKLIKAYRQRLLDRLKKVTPTKDTPPQRSTDDSDGDGVPDGQDKNPLVANPGIIRWEFHSLSLSITGPDKTKQTIRLIGNLYKLLEDADARKLHPLSLLGLNSINSLMQSNLQLDSGFKLPWGQRNRQEALRFKQLLQSKKDKEITITASVDIMFFNNSTNQTIILTKGKIPVLWKQEQLFAADCIEVEKAIEIPSNTRHGTLVRYATQLPLKNAMIIANRFQEAGPSISLPSSRLELTTGDTGIKLLDGFREMEKKTARISLRTTAGDAAWRVARKCGDTPVSIANALEALNLQLKAFNGKSIFIRSHGEIKSIAGVTNSTDSSWLAYANGRFFRKENQLAEAVPASLSFVLVQKKLIRDDFNAIQALRLSGQTAKDHLDKIGNAHFDEWVTGVEAGWPEALFLVATCVNSGICTKRDQRKSLRLHQLAAKRGLGASMNRLGEIYQIGLGVDMSDVRSVEWFKKAVQKGDPIGEDNLARCYYYGLGLKQDMAVAAALFKKAATKNHVFAINSMANLYMRGNGVKRDHKTAFAYFQKAADMGYAPAMTRVGSFYRLGLGVTKDLKKAFEWFKKAADAKQDAAYFDLAQAYEKGWGTPPNPQQAFTYYKLAYDADKPLTAYVMGRLYRDGIGCKKDINKAVGCFLKGAEKGDAASLAAIADLYLTGNGVKKNPQQAIVLLQKAGEAGHQSAWIALGEIFEMGKAIPANSEKALLYYQKAAKIGNNDAMAKVGWMYETGQGVKKDHAKALELYRKAADKGSPLGQSYLAIAYQYGHGVKKDMKEAIKWMQKAADQGDAKSLFYLADCYLKGDGVMKDMDMAYKLYLQSANLGDSKAQLEVGQMYYFGVLVPQNPKKAILWWKKAGNQGELKAQLYLGQLFENGKGTPRDNVKAAHWYQKAADQGNNQGKQGLARLKK